MEKTSGDFVKPRKCIGCRGKLQNAFHEGRFEHLESLRLRESKNTTIRDSVIRISSYVLINKEASREQIQNDQHDECDADAGLGGR